MPYFRCQCYRELYLSSFSENLLILLAIHRGHVTTAPQSCFSISLWFPAITVYPVR
jgi:hypothetical protein